MSLVIKKHSHTRGSTARIFRSIARLSDGRFVALTYNSNIAGKVGSSSEGNNIPKLYVTVYYGDWSVLQTVSIQIGSANTSHTLGVVASIAVDSSDNIHVVYNYRTSPQVAALKDQGQTLRYRKVTYNGSSLAVGSEVTVYSAAGYYSSVDIDVPVGTGLTNNPLIAFVHSSNGATFVTRLTQLTGLQTTQVHSVNSAARGVSLALNNSSGVASYRWVVSTYQMWAGSDVGDAIIWGSGTTTSAPVVGGTLAQNLNVGIGGGMRNLATFRDGNTFIIAGPSSANPYTHFFAAYSLPPNGSPTVMRAPVNTNLGGQYSAQSWYQASAVQLYTSSTRVIDYLTDGKNIYAQVLDYTVSGDNFTFVAQSPKWKMDQLYLGKNIEPALVSSGDRSRNGPVGINCMVDYPESYEFVMYRRVPISGQVITATLTSPANNGTVNRSNATLSVTVAGNSNNNLVGRVHIQTARDANFLTEVNNFYSGYQTFLNTVTVGVTLPAGLLGQGKYYVRVRVIDQLDFTYNYSPVQSFTITHKPIASIVSPARDSVAIYNPDDTVTFRLGFSDPDSTDTQTAYRIQVTTASGTVVADTGKVASSATVINIPIGSGNIDADIVANAWVWDSDNVQSDMTSSNFYLAVQPTVSFDSPTSGESVITATPTYSWIPVIPSSRSQAQYRITVRRGTTLVYDSKILNGTADTFVQPLGYLKNSTSYVVTVWIKDEIGMTASASVDFLTGWAKPVPLSAPIVDLSLYNELGFAYITIVPPILDPEVLPGVKVALMRRSLFSNSDWELVRSLQMGEGLDYSVIDSKLPSGVNTLYSAVLQVDNGGAIEIGDPDDSAPAKVVTPVGNYWLVSADNPEMNTPIPIVTADSFTEETEREVVVIANRGRWVDIGDVIGYNGSLTSRIYDKEGGLGGAAITNFLQNPRILSTGTGVSGIANWGLGNANYITRNTYSPCPVGKGTCIAIGQTTSLDGGLYQDVVGNPGNYLLSFWIETSLIAVGAGKSVSIVAQAKNSSGDILQTHSQAYNLTQSGSAMVPNGAIVYDSPIGEQFNWYRLNKVFTAPAGTTSIRVWIILNAEPGDYLTTGAAMLANTLNPTVRFFDGYTEGAEWTREDVLNSTSHSSGKVSARSARRRLMNLARSRETIFLRSPFGDIFQVSPGDIQVDRIAGTGADEFVTLTVPYLEIK